LRFGVFELNVTTEELRKSGTLIRLAPQPLKLLALLARRSGQVVTREEIQQTLWGEETYVDFEQGMNHCVKQIRSALSDSAETPLYVETVPRRGYRFLAPVVTKTIPAPPPRVVESQSGIQTRTPLSATPTGTPAPVTAVGTGTAAVVKPPEVAAPQPAPQPTATSPESATAPTRIPWKPLLLVAVLLLAVIAMLLYWHSRKAAFLKQRNTMAVAELENTANDPGGVFKTRAAVGLEQAPVPQ
jgi:DNA-binding winged helix-turn-helix (wHTH) protein